MGNLWGAKKIVWGGEEIFPQIMKQNQDSAVLQLDDARKGVSRN